MIMDQSKSFTTGLASDMASWTLAGSFAIIYLVYQACRILYDVYLGPLSKFPGPKLWAASSLPYLGVLWNGQEAVTKLALHQKYGPVVRVTPTSLSYSEAQAWKDIYGHRTTATKKSFPKDPKFYAPAINGAPSIIVSDDETHTRHRRILTHAFSDKALKEQEPLLRHWADLLVEKLRALSQATPTEAVELVSWWNFTTYVLYIAGIECATD